ncbi:EutN/CcmL family microcompartment protein [Synechococcus sp. PCC 7336]|uniref:EutN/CcmL family microcompartment protein n=1 Tax=Synechococcus sp. PCC 7336 TaxID=195250 RepID=UPI000360282C|nr:EutN/CcmL family microcompartment protein [Synechococcus sp. PCC 7336]
MKIAIVRGTVVSTQKEPSLGGSRLLLVQFIGADGEPISDCEVATDSVGAGEGEWVLVTLGSGARQIYSDRPRPVDALVVGIIDTVSVDKQLLYSKRDRDR